MRVLVACEFSGTVRRAFRERGHEAWSCDLLPSDDASPFHLEGDVMEVIPQGWDLMIAHPPCTHLAVSGARHFHRKQVEQAEALDFVRALLAAPIPRIALENPVSVISSRIRKPDQIVQPWMFGHPETKATCLWLKGLPRLIETNNVKAQMESLPANKRNRIHYMTPGPDRWKERSRTYQGLADAMAKQWGRRMTCPTCTRPMHTVQYILTPCDYDGASEYVCPTCALRVGRWSGLTLAEGELETRYGIDSPYRTVSQSEAAVKAEKGQPPRGGLNANTGAERGEEWLG